MNSEQGPTTFDVDPVTKKPAMVRRADPSDRDPLTTRKRTAEMLRRLRDLARKARMLKARVRTASYRNEQRDREDTVRRKQRRSRG